MARGRRRKTRSAVSGPRDLTAQIRQVLQGYLASAGTAAATSTNALRELLSPKSLENSTRKERAAFQYRMLEDDGNGNYVSSGRAPNPSKKTPGAFFTHELLSSDATTQLKRTAKTVRGGFREAGRVAVLADVAERGGLRGGIATGELVQTGVEGFQKASASRFVRSAFLKLAGRAGVRGLGIFSGALGIAAGAAGVALAATAAAGEYFAQRQASSRAQIAAFTSAAELQFNPETAKGIRERHRANVMATRGVYGQISDSLGFTENTEQEISDRSIAEMTRLNAARSQAARLGINVNDLYLKKAVQMGVAVSDLTNKEKNDALDPYIKAKVSRVPDSAVEAELIKRGIKTDTPVNVAVPGSMGGMYIRNANGLDEGQRAYLEGQRGKIRSELEERAVKEAVEKTAVEQRERERVIENRTPEQRLQIARELRRATFQLAAHRNRHRMKWSD